MSRLALVCFLLLAEGEPIAAQSSSQAKCEGQWATARAGGMTFGQSHKAFVGQCLALEAAGTPQSAAAPKAKFCSLGSQDSGCGPAIQNHHPKLRAGDNPLDK